MDKRGNISSRNMRLFAAIMTLIEALVLISLAGCAGKKVDYGTDTEKLTKSAVCNVKDFSTDETYSDEFSVQTEIGNVNIDISAKVELPDCKTMSVVEVEKIPYSAKLKEKVLKAYFGESQIYYYDKEHWTKTQLQNLIDSINSSTTPTDTSGTGNRAEFLKEYTHYLENAGDEWTIATEYDSCDEFVGKKGNTWYNVNFVADGDENKWLSGIGAGPIEGYTKKTGSNEYEWSNIFNDGYVQQYFGPDSLMEYDTVNDITDSQDTSGEGWTINELLFLFSFMFLTYGIFIIFFTGLRDFQYMVIQGDLDKLLIRPRGVLFQLLASNSDWFAALGHGLLGIVVFIYSSSKISIEWTMQKIILACSCVCSGVLIQGALFLMFASLSFFIVKTDNLRNVLYWNIKSFMGYPISIYPKLIQYFVVYIIPLAFVNYFPSQLLMGVFKEGNIFPAVYISISAALGMVLFGLSYLFWRFSLRFYASTGS